MISFFKGKEPHKARVLVIDDEVFIRSNLCTYLEDDGFIIFDAENAEQGLQVMASEKIDVCIVDFRLPGINGNVFIQKANLISPDTQFIIHTGSLEFELSAELKRIGLSDKDVFTKPVADMSQITLQIRNKL